MSDLIVITYHTLEEAEAAREKALELKKRGVLALDDAAIASRDADGHVHIRQLHSLVGAGTLGGLAWGALVGLLFGAPFVGMAAGGVAGVLGGKLTDIGVNDAFMKRVATTIAPGDHALFLLGTSRNTGRLLASVSAMGGDVIQTTLSAAQERELLRVWGRKRRRSGARDGRGDDEAQEYEVTPPASPAPTASQDPDEPTT